MARAAAARAMTPAETRVAREAARAAVAARRAAAAPAKPRTAPKRAPSQPRRRSGPAAKPRGSAAAPAKTRTTRGAAGPAPAQPRTQPRNPRPRTQPRTRSAPVSLGELLRARVNLLLDRLLRGRLWVVCIGFLLAGIVFLNVGLLQLNDQIGRTDKKSGQIGRENAALRIKLAKLDSTERIQRLAEAKGFVMPAPGAVRYVRSKSRDAREAAKKTIAPQPVTPPVPQAAVPAAAPTTGTGTVPGTTTPGATTPATTAPVPPAPAGAPAAAATAPQVP